MKYLTNYLHMLYGKCSVRESISALEHCLDEYNVVDDGCEHPEKKR